MKLTPAPSGLFRKTLAFPAILFLVVFLASCSSNRVEPVSGPIYELPRSNVNALELPPDLLTSGVDPNFRIPGGGEERVSVRHLDADTGARTDNRGSGFLTPTPELQILRDEQLRWISAQGNPDVWWNTLKEFWQTQNLPLLRDDPVIGIMETEWAENRAGLPLTGTQNLLGRLVGTLYDAGTRDQYRLRIDSANGYTEIFLTHRGAIERPGSGDQGWRWAMTEGNRELEAEMLNRLFVFLSTGESSIHSRPIEESDFERTGQVDLIDRDGIQQLRLQGDPNALWRRLGIGLDRAGLLVDEQNRSQNFILVTYRPELAEDQRDTNNSFFTRILGSRRDRREGQQYTIQISIENRELLIEIRDSDGSPLSSRDARFFLEKIQPQLR